MSAGLALRRISGIPVFRILLYCMSSTAVLIALDLAERSGDHGYLRSQSVHKLDKLQ